VIGHGPNRRPGALTGRAAWGHAAYTGRQAGSQEETEATERYSITNERLTEGREGGARDALVEVKS